MDGNYGYEAFSYENLTTLSYTDAIINFNPAIINSKLKSKYLLFEEKGNQQYNHLGIAEDNITGQRYIETYFQQPDRAYINGQTIVKVKSFTLVDAAGKVIVTDLF